jgi:glucosamine--fructose-6-phosphate aminotransferase (isomerizing)
MPRWDDQPPRRDSASGGATEDSISPIIFSIPLQLLAYHVAVLKGTDIDQPRNLAKSVTVE